MRAVSVVLETLRQTWRLSRRAAAHGWLMTRCRPMTCIQSARKRFAEPVTVPLPKAKFEAGRFAVRPGEVIVLTGSANAVFEQQQGRFETQLALSAAKQQPGVRHMSWDGDTVYEQARAENFGGWAEQFAAVGASTIIAWFGGLEALDDSHNDEAFATAYGKLLDEFAKTTPRLVVISPAPIEKPLGRWVRDNTPRNVRLKKFTAIAEKLAKERGAVFVDIFTPLAARGAGAARLTDDGIHLTPDGQRIVADLIAEKLGVSSSLGEAQEPLRKEIVHKNRFWFDCWRTLNWNFPYSDRKWAMFSKPAGTRPPLAEELKQWKPFIKAADARVHALALGQTPPPLPAVNALPEEKRQPPDEELKAFTPRDGFEINLFASEADGLVKPILFTWDERGRLWALCAPSYPQLIPGTVANDYILICEDTDGDGRADKFNRFAEGLFVPTGLALGDGGVYVCQSKEIIHLRDTDGDDHADQRRRDLFGLRHRRCPSDDQLPLLGTRRPALVHRGFAHRFKRRDPLGADQEPPDRRVADEPAHAGVAALPGQCGRDGKRLGSRIRRLGAGVLRFGQRAQRRLSRSGPLAGPQPIPDQKPVLGDRHRGHVESQVDGDRVHRLAALARRLARIDGQIAVCRWLCRFESTER